MLQLKHLRLHNTIIIQKGGDNVEIISIAKNKV